MPCSGVPFHMDLLVGVVELDRVLGREDRLRRRRDAAIQPDFFFGRGRLRPFGNEKDLTKQDVWIIAVIEGYRVTVSGGWQGRIGVPN